MKIGNVNCIGTITAPRYEKVYETTLGANTTSVTISSLDGDTAELYELILAHKANGASYPYLLMNNDSGNNYGYEEMRGTDTVALAVRVSSQPAVFFNISTQADQEYLFSRCNIFAKSGKNRTIITNYIEKISSTTITRVGTLAQTWNNTADNLTSLVISSSVSNGLATGTYISLYKKVE